MPFDDDRAPIRVALDGFDPRDRMCLEVGEHSVPIELSDEPEAQQKPTVRDEAIVLSPPCAQRSRRVLKDVPARTVELAQAAETGGKRDFRHGEIGVVEQPSCEMHARRAREPVGSDTKVIDEESTQVTCRYPEAVTEFFLVSAVERTLRISRTARHTSSGAFQSNVCG